MQFKNQELTLEIVCTRTSIHNTLCLIFLMLHAHAAFKDDLIA